MSDVDGGDAEGRGLTRAALRRTDGELILLWTLPVALILWIAGFFLFPGFNPPMSPDDAGGAGCRVLSRSGPPPGDPVQHDPVQLVRRVPGADPGADRACRSAGWRIGRRSSPTRCWGAWPAVRLCFLVANVCWLLAAFRPERSPELTQLLNDFAWITFTILVPFLIGQSVILALAIYFDDQPRPVFNRWVAHFNLLVAAALVPAAFVGVALTGPLAWDGFLSFWVKNIAIAVWIVVMGVVLGQAVYRERAEKP